MTEALLTVSLSVESQDSSTRKIKIINDYIYMWVCVCYFSVVAKILVIAQKFLL
jgi:hypothetical protein